MNATMMIAGYLYTSLILLACVVLCRDYARRWWKERQEANARTARIERKVMGAIASQATPDGYVRPMGVTPPTQGWIAESRFHLEADSDAEVIAKLIGEVE